MDTTTPETKSPAVRRWEERVHGIRDFRESWMRIRARLDRINSLMAELRRLVADGPRPATFGASGAESSVTSQTTHVDFLLMAELQEALRLLQVAHDWDLSSGEEAKFLEILYPQLARGFPSNQGELRSLLETARGYVWDDDHERHDLRPEELADFVASLLDSAEARGIRMMDYLENLGLA